MSEARDAGHNVWSECAFEHAAEHHPEWLLRLIRSGELPAADLTFAAEYVGRVTLHAEARAALLPLLEHEDAVVREGAVYGLRGHMDLAVWDALARVAQQDPSAAVRSVARDALAK